MSDDRDNASKSLLSDGEAERLLSPAALALLRRYGLAPRIELTSTPGAPPPDVARLLRDLPPPGDEADALGRLAELSRLGAGVIHECRNVMTGILGFTQVARQRAGDNNPPFFEILRMIESESQRAIDLLRQYLDLARGDDRLPESVDTEAAIRRVAEVVLPQWNALISLEVSVEAGTPALRARPQSLQQVLVNVVLNAMHAIESREPGRGRVRIEASGDGEHVSITVIDDGPGIDPKVASRIFDAFFSTKARGRGAGLGLYISRRLVEADGGTLTVESALGSGTKFFLRLPRAQDPPGEPA